jgi:hypothetical protein
MKNIILIVLIFLIASCFNNEQKQKNISNSKKATLTKEEFYLSKMKEKNFQLTVKGACEDALDDTTHKLKIVYYESKIFTDSNLIVEFKFKDACCQKFLGDYTIDDKIVKFRLEQINNEMCDCLCWYRYNLTINKVNHNYIDVEIEKK